GAGQLLQGSANAFDGLNRLQVNGADYTPTLPTTPAGMMAEVSSTGAPVTLSTSAFTAVGPTLTFTIGAGTPVLLRAPLLLHNNAGAPADGQVAFMVDGATVTASSPQQSFRLAFNGY